MVHGARNAEGLPSLPWLVGNMASPPAVSALPLPTGMLRVSGLLPTGCKMLDTPGVPHAYQVQLGW